MSTDENQGPVIVAGAGPTGLTLATELRRGGADVVLLERRPHRGVDGSRAAGMQPRTVEMLDQRGVVDRFLAVGPRSDLGAHADAGVGRPMRPHCPPSGSARHPRAYRTEAEIFPDIGHDMMLEPGWVAVAERIHTWLCAQDL